MSRVSENEAVKKQVDAKLNDTELAAAVMNDVNKAVPIALVCLIPIIFDISKSLAVIADALIEMKPKTINDIREKAGFERV